MAIARQLSRLGVDVCEAGFPIASDGDFAAVERIAKEVGPLVAGRYLVATSFNVHVHNLAKRKRVAAEHIFFGDGSGWHGGSKRLLHVFSTDMCNTIL